MNSLSFSAGQILAIQEPERLFGTPDAVHNGFRSLARKWHPDVTDGDADVFAHINKLHLEAKHLIDVGFWHAPGLFEFTASGKQYRVHYVKAFDFELGKVLLGKTLLTYVIDNAYADQASNARKIITDLKFPDHKTREVMSRYLPKLVTYHETASHVVMAVEKPADLIRLRDLLDHLGGTLDSKHVAWIVSRMLNHATYLQTTGMTHNDISLDTLFVCPEHHTVCLLGGWWYAAEIGTSLKGHLLPQRTVANGPSDLITKKLATLHTDPQLVRLTARELLGDGSGAHLMRDTKLPKPMVQWLLMSGDGSALKDYTQWYAHVLEASFGPRRFVKFAVTAEQVYAELGP